MRFSLKDLEYFRKRTLRHLRIDAAQRIVRAQLDNSAIHLFIEAPFEARKAVRRGIAGNARIQHAHGIALFPECCLQLGRKRLGRRNIKSRGQTIAEREDHDLVLVFRRLTLRGGAQAARKHDPRGRKSGHRTI